MQQRDILTSYYGGPILLHNNILLHTSTNYYFFKDFETFIPDKIFLNKEGTVEAFEQFIGENINKFCKDGIFFRKTLRERHREGRIIF